ncbi:hypothetical protein GCM10017771_05060 [Streptomyces capitiformicae]|uniref:Uncharacterized protein n=1 Tax=Streptomyces capitiformicae TaxID=2014920 RepID=A0A919L434_9ACTN|nr:hypothetical protein GCM10017771_05060 [Streptomyces capitiformicae]
MGPYVDGDTDVVTDHDPSLATTPGAPGRFPEPPPADPEPAPRGSGPFIGSEVGRAADSKMVARHAPSRHPGYSRPYPGADPSTPEWCPFPTSPGLRMSTAYRLAEARAVLDFHSGCPGIGGVFSW